MNTLLNNLAFLGLTLFAVSAHAQQQSSMELTCRAKAKEVAASTYSGCVTEARNTQIDQIRKDYQKQLSELKAKYDRELKKVGGKGVNSAAPATEAAKAAPVATNVSKGPAPKPTKGIARTLPTRKEMKPAAPVVQDAKEDKVVVTPDSTAPGVDSEQAQPTQNDANGDVKIELVPTGADKQSASIDEQTY